MPKKKPKEPKPILVGYARVSTEDQNLDMQIQALKRAGVPDDNLHVEKISAGAKSRPKLDMAILDLMEGDTLVVWRLDRLARNMRDLFARLDRIKAKGASFRSLTEGFDMSTAMGQLYMHIAGAFAEFERQIIADRTRAGIAAYKERTGKGWGMDKVMTPKALERGDKLAAKGWSGPRIAKALKVSTASIYGHYERRGTRLHRKRR